MEIDIDEMDGRRTLNLLYVRKCQTRFMFSKPLLKVNQNLQFKCRFATMFTRNWTKGMHGRSLELFFINGRPDGMLTAEVFGWTGHILVAPRTQIGDALKRPKSSYTGVYILLGETDEGNQVYIGEGEEISQRIKSHDSKKDWWTSAILITSAANNLNKAHVKYLESRLVEKAHEVGHSLIENGNAPTRPSLSEAAQSNMESFLDNILMILPALSVETFLQKSRPSNPNSNAVAVSYDNPDFEIISKQLGLSAVATLSNGEFVVQAGSIARGQWEGTVDHNYHKLYKELVQKDVLIVEGNRRAFATNYAFKSPSAAGAMIFGRACNGQTAWKVKGTKKTYRDWEEEQLADFENHQLEEAEADHDWQRHEVNKDC